MVEVGASTKDSDTIRGSPDVEDKKGTVYGSQDDPRRCRSVALTSELYLHLGQVCNVCAHAPWNLWTVSAKRLQMNLLYDTGVQV